MDIPTVELIQARILQASHVPEAVRLNALPFSPCVNGTFPSTAQAALKESTMWETDSLGNFLTDPDEPDPEYFC